MPIPTVVCSKCGQKVNKAQTLSIGSGMRACKSHEGTMEISQSLLQKQFDERGKKPKKKSVERKEEQSSITGHKMQKMGGLISRVLFCMYGVLHGHPHPTRATRFVEDLKANEMDLDDLRAAINEEFHVNIGRLDPAEIRTVGDLCDFIAGLINNASLTRQIFPHGKRRPPRHPGKTYHGGLRG